MTEEVVEQQTEEQEDALLAEGYKRAGGDTPAPKEPVVEASEPEKPEVEAKEPEPDPWKDVPPVVRQHLENISATLPKFDQRLKSAEGVMGAIRAGQDAAKAAAKAGYEAPALEQIKAAGASTEKWDELKENFPDWAEGLAERDAAREAAFAAKIEAQLEAHLKRAIDAQAPLTEKQRAEMVHEAEELAVIRIKHPTWKQTVNTAEFLAWRKAQAPDIQALGASTNADDAVRMLDLYGDYTKQVEATVKKQAKTQERLEAAIPVKGQGSGGPTVPSEDELLAIGYKRAGGGK